MDLSLCENRKMCLLYFLLLMFWTVATFAGEPLYRAIGDKAVLTPESAVNPITSIEWKHGLHIAMEWYGKEIISYRQFRDWGKLNTSTGALTITGLTREDSGIYTAEINHKLTSKTELLVISPVPKPELSVRCETTYCVFTCNGNTAEAEPVTYRWWSGDMTWPSTKEYNITEEENEPWFRCEFENPVSYKSSEKVSNPFIKNGRTAMFIIIPIIGLILVVLILVVSIIYYKYRKGKTTNWTMEGNTNDERQEENFRMLNPAQETPVQDPTSVVVDQTTSNGVGRTESLHCVQETSTQDAESAVAPETTNATESSAGPEVPETSAQDPEAAAPASSKETEKSVMTSDEQETPSSDVLTDEQAADGENETKM